MSIQPTVIGTSAAASVAPSAPALTPVAVAPVAATVTVAETAVEKNEKTARLELPTPTELVALEVSESKTVTVVEVTEALAYSQVLIGAKTMKNLEYVAGNKSGMIIIDNTDLINKAAVAKFIAEGIETELVLVKITYGDYAKLRLSAGSTGKSKIKKTTKSAFFDRDLNGMIEIGDEEDGAFQYIYGMADTEFTKEANTRIARVVKTIENLYDDKDKNKGFHKANTKIPVNDLGLRTNDNYTFFFKWENIEAKMQDNGATIAKIVKIINAVYPNIVVDTTKPLFMEALKSTFSTLREDRLVWDDAKGEIVSKAVEIAAKKEADLLEKERIKNEKAAAKKEEKAAAKAAAADSVEGEAPALPAGIAPAVNADATPILGDAATLLNGLSPLDAVK